jgi:hypothetical protein
MSPVPVGRQAIAVKHDSDQRWLKFGSEKMLIAPRTSHDDKASARRFDRNQEQSTARQQRTKRVVQSKMHSCRVYQSF